MDERRTARRRGWLLAAAALAGCRSAAVGPAPRPASGGVAAAPSGGSGGSSGLDLGVEFSRAQEAPSAASPGADQEPGEAGPGAPATAAAPTPFERDYPLSGWLSLGARARWSGDGSDGDLFGFLALDGGDEAVDPVTFHVSGRALVDLSGGKSSDDPFFEVSDTYDNGVNARLYRAHLDVHTIEALELLRIGRQQDIRTPVPAYYDGLHARTQPLGDLGFQLGAYGGLSTHLFESTNGDDRVVGAYVEQRPWEQGRLRLDWMRARDHRRSDGDAQDMYSVSAWQTLFETLDLEGFYSRFRGKSRDLRLSGVWFTQEHDLQLRATYYRLLARQTTNALEFDPFTSSLLDFVPYGLLSLAGTKGLGERYRVALGADLRRLEDAGNAGQFNRDFDRYYMTFTRLDLWSEDSSLSLTAENWDGGDKRYSTLGADLSADVSAHARGSLGMFFSMYKISSLTFEEREDVQTWFVRLDQDLAEDLRLNASYQFEDAEIADFHVLRVDLRWSL